MTIFKQFESRMASEVKSGQITREAADKRLAGLKEKLWGNVTKQKPGPPSKKPQKSRPEKKEPPKPKAK
ncbi:MAG: hypothetical protein CMJ45_07475 [Planctomyces sp.]|jgi:hypothetical protein|nr:hypothetical protein [Planctomyces sp.]